MYAYSEVSQDRIDECEQDIKTIWAEVIKWIDATVFCGHRGEADQNKAFAEKTSQLKWPDSEHNKIPSNAIDSGPYFVEIRNVDWKDGLAFAFFAGRVCQIAAQLLSEGKVSHELIWGGDWDKDGRTADHKFKDLPHFQLRKVPK